MYENLCTVAYLSARVCVLMADTCVFWLCGGAFFRQRLWVVDVAVMGECSLDLHTHIHTHTNVRDWGQLELKEQINGAFYTVSPPQSRQAD